MFFALLAQQGHHSTSGHVHGGPSKDQQPSKSAPAESQVSFHDELREVLYGCLLVYLRIDLTFNATLLMPGFAKIFISSAGC